MHYDISVLRAIVRLSRRRIPTNGFFLEGSALLERIPGRASDLRASLRRLSRAGFLDVKPFGDVSLTLSGLTVAVASMPPKRRAQPVLRRAA